MGSVLSLSLSLCVCVSRLSLSRSRVQREKQTNNSSNNNNGNNTKRERVTTKEFVFSDVCLFSTFSEIPQKETRAELCISSSPFCLVSALLLLFLLLKKSAFLRRILLCARPYCILLSKVQETSAKAAHKRLLGDLITWPTFLCESTRNATTRVRLQ